MSHWTDEDEARELARVKASMPDHALCEDEDAATIVLLAVRPAVLEERARLIAERDAARAELAKAKEDYEYVYENLCDLDARFEAYRSATTQGEVTALKAGGVGRTVEQIAANLNACPLADCDTLNECAHYGCHAQTDAPATNSELVSSKSVATTQPRHQRTWPITLNRYQRDNLLWVFMLGGYYPGPWKGPRPAPVRPFDALNTGDWFGEIPWMLVRDDESCEDAGPNVTVEEMRQRMARPEGDPIRHAQHVSYAEGYRDGKASAAPPDPRFAVGQRVRNIAQGDVRTVVNIRTVYELDYPDGSDEVSFEVDDLEVVDPPATGHVDAADTSTKRVDETRNHQLVECLMCPPTATEPGEEG